METCLVHAPHRQASGPDAVSLQRRERCRFAQHVSDFRNGNAMPPMLRITGPRPAFDTDALLGSAEGTSLATYQPKDVIFSQGDEADSVMYLLDGAVKLSVSSRSGKEAVVAML